jgi:hypothetical protein
MKRCGIALVLALLVGVAIIARAPVLHPVKAATVPPSQVALP